MVFAIPTEPSEVASIGGGRPGRDECLSVARSFGLFPRYYTHEGYIQSVVSPDILLVIPGVRAYLFV